MNINYIDFSIRTKSLDIFFSGCNAPYCEDCCNPELIDFNNGKNWKEYLRKICSYTTSYNSLVDKFFLVGGSPNHQNSVEMKEFLTWLSKFNKDIYLFAREELDNIQPIFKEHCEYIKCGAYIPEFTCEDNIQYGIKLATSNQYIYKRGLNY